MKLDSVLRLIRAHYSSATEFYKTVESLADSEEKAGNGGVARQLRQVQKNYNPDKNGFSFKAINKLIPLKDGINLCDLKQPTIKLNDVICSDEIQTVIKTIVTEYQNREKFKEYGLPVSNRLILSGPPGVGKTWTGMAIAGELGLDVLYARWDAMVSSYLGSTGKNIRSVFEVAEKQPIVLFLDEFDTIGKSRGDEKEVGELSRVVTTLLQNIDIFPENSILIAATNHGQLLDSAIWRRFTVVEMGLPDMAERVRLIKYYASGKPFDGDFDDWGVKTEGMSGAEIKDAVFSDIKKNILSENFTSERVIT